MNLNLIQEHIEKYPCEDEIMLSYRKQHMRMSEKFATNYYETKEIDEVAAIIAKKIQKLLD